MIGFEDLSPLMMSLSDVLIVILSFIGCYLIYFGISKSGIIKLEKERKRADTVLRIINSLYSIFMVILGTYWQYRFPNSCNSPNSKLLQKAVLFSMGYYIYDLVAFQVNGLNFTFKIIHHLSGLIGEYETFIKGVGGTVMITWAIWLEIPNPFLQTRKMLLNYNLKETKLFLLVEGLYIGIYTLSRIIYIKFCYSYYSTCSDGLIVLKISVVVLLLQSALLIYQMLDIVKKRISELKERQANSIELYWFETNPLVLKLEYNKLVKIE